MTALKYLGEFESIAACETYRKGSVGADWAFGWTHIDFKNAKNQRCFIGWVPDRNGNSMGSCCLPVFNEKCEPPPNVAPMESWSWDGEIEEPTLHPSISRTVQKTRDGEIEEIAHGWIKQGAWHPC